MVNKEKIPSIQIFLKEEPCFEFCGLKKNLFSSILYQVSQKQNRNRTFQKKLFFEGKIYATGFVNTGYLLFGQVLSDCGTASYFRSRH
jgi:hypothetical protein